MYKLFTDKSELFECDIKLEGASLSKSKARLVVETSDYSLLFNGSISSGGKCEIPIRKLKGLIGCERLVHSGQAICCSVVRLVEHCILIGLPINM